MTSKSAKKIRNHLDNIIDDEKGYSPDNEHENDLDDNHSDDQKSGSDRSGSNNRDYSKHTIYTNSEMAHELFDQEDGLLEEGVEEDDIDGI